MRILLDTHILIWFFNGDRYLSRKGIDSIENIQNACFISIASLWELSIKISLGKLNINGYFEAIHSFLQANDIQILPVDFNDLVCLKKLPFHHRDPFDRLIIAQAQTNGFTVITHDANFEKYNISLFKS